MLIFWLITIVQAKRIRLCKLIINSKQHKCNTSIYLFSQKFRRFGKIVEVVDTPGLFDTDITDEKQVAVHKELLKALVLTTPGFHVIAFVLSKRRFTDEIQKTRDLFFNWFGKHVGKYACIILTDTDTEEAKEKYTSNNPHPKLVELLHMCDYKVLALDNKGSDDTKDIQIKKFFELFEKIKQNNGGKHFSNVCFKLASSYINDRRPKKLTTDSMRIINRFEGNFSKAQKDILQGMLTMNTANNAKENVGAETTKYEDMNDELDVKDECNPACSERKGNLLIIDNVTNEVISNTQAGNSGVRQLEDNNGSDNDCSTSKTYDNSFEVTGKNVEQRENTALCTQQNVRGLSTNQVETDNSADENNSAKPSKSPTPSQYLDDFKNRISGENEGEKEELNGMLKYIKEAWVNLKTRVRDCTLL